MNAADWYNLLGGNVVNVVVVIIKEILSSVIILLVVGFSARSMYERLKP